MRQLYCAQHLINSVSQPASLVAPPPGAGDPTLIPVLYILCHEPVLNSTFSIWSTVIFSPTLLSGSQCPSRWSDLFSAMMVENAGEFSCSWEGTYSSSSYSTSLAPQFHDQVALSRWL